MGPIARMGPNDENLIPRARSHRPQYWRHVDKRSEQLTHLLGCRVVVLLVHAPFGFLFTKQPVLC
jgi:hypothetical protein